MSYREAVDATLDGLIDDLARDLRPLEERIRGHSLLDALERGALPLATLQAFAAEQYRILRSDRRSFAQLAVRFPEEPSGSFFLTMAAREGEALARLLLLAAALGSSEEDLVAYESRPGCHAYPAFVSWLALNGSRLDVALSFLVNLDAWGANCDRMGRALEARYGLEAHDLAFFEFFAAPPAGFRDVAVAVAGAGLRAGEAMEPARRAARLLQAYELLFWDSLLEAEPSPV
jgi:hypothetical protein